MRRLRLRSRPMSTRLRRTGFTLVEVLIVVVAMLIFAGMVIPQFQTAVEEARRSSAMTTLRDLTVAIELYRMHHDGVPPDDLTGNSLPQLTSPTDSFGNVGAGPEYFFGPYLFTGIPANQMNGSRRVTLADTVPPRNLEHQNGWIYDPDSGQIWAGEADYNVKNSPN